MRYDDFSPEDQRLIDIFLEKYNEEMESQPFGYIGIYPEELQDDEVFFRTKDEIREVAAELDAQFERGGYREMADDLMEYLDGTEYDVEDFVGVYLGWGTIARVGEDRYLFMSNSWSDSGVFLNR